MAKPRIFVSSTYYDLKHIRRHVESFIKLMGYESVLFENGDIPFHHDQPLDESCYDEIENCHILVLIIGGKYGSAASADTTTATQDDQKEELYQYYNSITRNEYLKAREKNIPIFIFVEKGVYAEYDTFKKNRENTSITYAHVDSINVFKLLDDIIVQRTNNFVRGFENFDDITNWLKDQWAGIFADFLSRKTTDIKIKKLEEQIEELKEISTALKVYNEAMMRSSNVQGVQQIIEKEERKLMIKKAIRLKNEDLIQYLLMKIKNDKTEDEIWETFTSTDSLASFVVALGGSQSFANILKKPAQRDYLKLRNDYLDESNKIDDEKTIEFSDKLISDFSTTFSSIASTIVS